MVRSGISLNAESWYRNTASYFNVAPLWKNRINLMFSIVSDEKVHNGFPRFQFYSYVK